MLMTGTGWVRVKGLFREVPNVSWIIHDLTVVMTSTERFPKFKMCEVFQWRPRVIHLDKAGTNTTKRNPGKRSGSEQVAVEKTGIEWPTTVCGIPFWSLV
jgi:hypothetical protein